MLCPPSNRRFVPDPDMAGPSSLRAPNNYFADCETFHVRVIGLMLPSGAELILGELDNTKTAAGRSDVAR